MKSLGVVFFASLHVSTIHELGEQGRHPVTSWRAASSLFCP